MNILMGRFAGLVALSALASTAQAVGVCDLTPKYSDTNSETGHFYEVYEAPNIDWPIADGQVKHRNVYCPREDGVPGHLATITSAAEDAWVDELRRKAGLGKPEVWVGGRQQGDLAGTRGKGWFWDNGEGEISTSDSPRPSYSNWLTGEPNDNTGPGSENFLAIGLRNEFGWNDEGALGNIGGYIVEYDLPRSAACEPDSEGGSCNTIEGQKLVFPGKPEELNGLNIGFNAFEFADPRVDDQGVCTDRRALRLFGDRDDPEDANADSYDNVPGNTLVIPEYLCGSPKFVAVRVNSEELAITSGTVLVENDTATVLPGNVYPDGTIGSPCKDPNLWSPYPDGDPQYQDVVVWQSTNPAKMREVKTGVAGVGTFAGAAGEFTDSCGSSRAKILGASYFVVGMHIDFGATNTWAGNPDGNHERFVALTRYKLELLLDSIVESRSSGALLKNGDFNKMQSMIVNAIKFLDDGDYVGALGKVDNFVKFITPALYRSGEGIPNYMGEHISRGSNVAFTLRVKVIPYAGP